MRHSWLLGLLLMLLAGCTAAERQVARHAESPGSASAEPPATAVHSERWILVRKTDHTLSLYEGNQLVKMYPAVFGKDPYWAKLYEGDCRTPEGEYHIVDKYFHPYWERFMLLDYPTSANHELYAWSREHGLLPARGRRPPGIGGAIGIHGTENEGLNERGVNWTRGCVSLFNRDVEELYDLVPVGTRVVIER